MAQSEKDMKQYIHEIEKLLLGSRKDKQTFLADYEKFIRGDMEETEQEYDYGQLVQMFGAPAMIAENYAYAFEEKASEAAKKNVKKRIIISAVCALLIITCFVLLSYLIKDSASYYIGNYNTSLVGKLP